MSHCVKQIAGGRYRCEEPANARGIYCDRHDPQVLEIARIKARQEKRTRDAAEDMLAVLREIASAYPGSPEVADLADLARGMVQQVEGSKI